jgi:2,3-bisphosphoglycerate-independent phosphoglycerate mutase
MNNKKALLIILDGYGEGKNYFGNAITNAKDHFVDELRKIYPNTLLKTDSEAVGLPPCTMGGSEVGHFTIGAGRVVFQMLELINRSISSGDFFEKPEFLTGIENVKKHNSKLHLIGMLSNAGVHSHQNHLFSLLELAKKHQIPKEKVFIHIFTDGRDVPEKSAQKFLTQLENKIQEIGIGQIATICGRFFAMDRDTNFDRTQKSYDLMCFGKGYKATNALEAIKQAYERGEKTDYYIEPTLINDQGLIETQDTVINFNYRSDRSAQITDAFTDKNFIHFETPIKPHYICLGPYGKFAPIVFNPPKVSNNLGEIIAKNDFNQLRIAETEKYPHVTFFFNSQVKEAYKNEKRILVPSPKVPSYAEQPQMSAHEITKAFLDEIDKKDDYKLVVINFANPDLVGHSGDLHATEEAVDTVHECLAEIIKKAQAKNFTTIITADHGNAEYMIYEETLEPCPAHTLNKVIFMIVDDEFKNAQLRQEETGLQDIAPTILDILDIEKPSEMTGESLLENKI